MTEGKSLAQWRFEIKTVGKKHWGVFYNDMLGKPPSNYPRFYKAILMYGDLHMFEAIVLASNQENLTGDPLAYTCKIAHTLWKTEQQQIDTNDNYEREISKATLQSRAANEALEKKLQKIGVKSAGSTVQ